MFPPFKNLPSLLSFDGHGRIGKDRFNKEEGIGKTIKKCSGNVKKKGYSNSGISGGVEKISQFCLNGLMEERGYGASG
jgi:hypothetical protein